MGGFFGMVMIVIPCFILVFLLIKLCMEEVKWDGKSVKELLTESFETQSYIVRKYDRKSWSSYKKAKKQGVAMITSEQMAYAKISGLLQKDAYYCLHREVDGKDDYSLWLNDEVIFTMAYNFLLEDLVKNDVIITEEETSEMLHWDEVSEVFKK